MTIPGQPGGQVPPTQPPTPDGQVPPTPTPPTEDKPTLTLEQALDALEKERKKQAKDRVDAKRLAELEAAEQTRKDSELSDVQRAQKAAADAEARATAAETAAKERVALAEVKAEAVALGIKPALAARLIDLSEIEYDADGEPKNIAKLLGQLIKDFDLTPASQNTPTTPPVSSGKPANPGRGQTLGGWNWDAISRLDAAAYAALSPEQKTELSLFIKAHPRPPTR